METAMFVVALTMGVSVVCFWLAKVKEDWQVAGSVYAIASSVLAILAILYFMGVR